MSTATATQFDPVEHLTPEQRARYAALVAAREVLRNNRDSTPNMLAGSRHEYDAVEAVDLIDVAEFILGDPDPLGEGQQPWPTSPAQQTPWPYPHGPESAPRDPYGWLPAGPLASGSATPEPEEASSPDTPPEDPEVTVKHGDSCPTCKGTGTIVPAAGEGGEAVTCPSCEGSGRWVDPF